MTDATRPDLPVPQAQPQPRAGASSPAAREALGRLVHGTRLAHVAERAEAEGRAPFLLGSWEERSPEQQQLDMRIGEAVAAYALEQNALSWNTDCTGCAALLDSGIRETEQREAERERAAARIAGLKAALRRHAVAYPDGQGAWLCGGCGEPVPCSDSSLTGDEPS